MGKVAGTKLYRMAITSITWLAGICIILMMGTATTTARLMFCRLALKPFDARSGGLVAAPSTPALIVRKVCDANGTGVQGFLVPPD